MATNPISPPPVQSVPARSSRSWWRRWNEWAEPLGIFVGWRVALTLLGFLAPLLLPGVEHAGTAPRLALTPGSFYERLVGIWSHWDGEWFLHVAGVGYLPGEATSPFFPLYPLLVRLVSLPLLGNFLLAGVLVNLVASGLVFVLLYQLVKGDAGAEVARRSSLYLAIFPTSFFLAACYSESVFLALTLAAFVAARHWKNWWLAGLFVALAALSRNIGILLLVPLGWESMRDLRFTPLRVLAIYDLRLGNRGRGEVQEIAPDKGSGLLREDDQLEPRSSIVNRGLTPKGGKSQIVNSLFVGLPLLAFGAWLGFQAVVLGDALNFVSVQNTPVWNRHRAWPWEGVLRAFDLLGRTLAGAKLYRDDPNTLDLLFWLSMALSFLLVAYQTARRRLPLSYLLYFAIAFLLPLTSPANKEPLLSFPRFALIGWPAFVALAQIGLRRPWLHYAYLFTAALLLGLLFARFANWLWVA